MHEGAPVPISVAAALAVGIAAGATAGVARAAGHPPSVLLVTVDTLRPVRMSGYGYGRPTSPCIDELFSRGTRFAQARTIEPLTNPALSTMVTGMLPHEHAASRNGLRIQEGLDSLPKVLARNGWKTAAIVSNWTLKDSISGLAEHFADYIEVFTRRRWFGVINAEATAEDVTDEAIDWLEGRLGDPEQPPVLLWVHYVEPHAPYRFHEEFAERLGIEGEDPPRSDRYDTEVAAVDFEIGRLLDWVERRIEADRVLVVFASDHGESLGEHGDWGHGRNLYEPGLRIPLSFTWVGTVEQRVVDAPAQIVDIPVTVLDLIGLPSPPSFRGVSLAASLRGRGRPAATAACYQAHRGAVKGDSESDRARSKGLLEVGTINGDRKEVLRIPGNERRLFDLDADPGELHNLADPGSTPGPELVRCIGEISDGLGSLDRLSTGKLDHETVEQLRTLGYLD
ncbi:MAG TPA: sulfatase [Thermoanaerobaculales bacterium]|nr:sulfatase [Thermoanaerobaculales bacterium]